METKQSLNDVDVRELLGDLAKLDAIEVLIKERRAAVRDQLEIKVRAIASTTNAAPALRIKGIGQAYITQPTMRPVVTDDRKFGEFVRKNFTQRCQVVEDLDKTALMLAMAEIPDLDFAVRQIGCITERVIYDERLLEELAATFELSQGGALIDSVSGEIIDVVLQPASKASFTVRSDKDFVSRLAERLRALDWEPPPFKMRLIAAESESA